MFRLFKRNLDELEDKEVKLLVDRSYKIALLSKKLAEVFAGIKSGKVPRDKDTSKSIRETLTEIQKFLGDDEREVKTVIKQEKKKR